MKIAYIFSPRAKKYGWVLLALGAVLGIWYLATSPELSFFSATIFAIVSEDTLGPHHYFTFIENNILDELICIALIVGGLLVAFSREPIEDEFILKLRLESLIWATWVNYLILLFAILFIYDFPFFTALVLHMTTTLLLFISKFRWSLYKSTKLAAHEE